MRSDIIVGESRSVLSGIPDNTFTAIVTDPPYGLVSPNVDIAAVLSSWLSGNYDMDIKGGFMGKKWDSFVPPPNLWKEVFRVLKPGGTLLCFSGSRTIDLMGISLRLGGFIIRDTIEWLYSSGYPKAYDIAKGIEGKLLSGSANWSDWDKLDGEKVMSGMGYTKTQFEQGYRPADYRDKQYNKTVNLSTPEAKTWDGMKSHALKPAHEPILVAMKPNDGSYVDNALTHGVGGLNINGSRLNGYYPPNVLVDDFAAGVLVGQTKKDVPMFMVSKPSVSEKNRGVTLAPRQKVYNGKSQESSPKMKDIEKRFTTKPASNFHPTVKPIALMNWLLGLVTQPGENLILDPFLGSGTTGIAARNLGLDFVGIEMSQDYATIAKQRIEHEKASKLF